MKTKYFLLGVIFALLGAGAQAQITEILYQGFESGETVRYTGSPSAGIRSSSSIVLSGSKALKLVQQSDSDVEVIFDTMDFTGDLTLKYIALEFDHICPIPINGSSDINIGTIWWKRTNQTEWNKLSDQEYDKQDGASSTAFQTTGCFNENSYKDVWKGQGSTTNDMWKHERFNLNNVLTSSLAAQDRKFQIKLVLKKRTLSSTLDTVNCAWWIDNMRVSSSAEQMINPKINMWFYPHVEEYANSRCARVELDATTVVAAGINPDSVYMCYRVGSDPSIVKVSMTNVSGSRYKAEIPFFGYDTAMSFYCLVRDATGNQNTATFPAAVNSWCNFHFVRGTENIYANTQDFVSSGTFKSYGFTKSADHRAQFVYDSTLLATAGYKAGAITKLRLVAAEASESAETRKNFQIRMRNIPGSYEAGDDGLMTYYFDNSHMSVVYNDDYTLPVLAAGDTFTINLQDTFFYAGRGLLMQFWYDDDVDHTGQSIKVMPAPTNNHSCYTLDFPSSMGAHAFVDADFKTINAGGEQGHRPVAIFYAEKNQPLYYDAGISELTTPNYYVAMEKSVGLLRVKLKNFGSRTLNAVRISYQIDDTISGYKDWTGTLNGGADESVDVATITNIAAGFHKLTVWVEDSVTASSVLYRDHEPFNDTMTSEFIVCDGPMNGVRNIGGSNPHFNDIEEFLFSLNRCGIDDSLIVRLAPGYYPPFTMPTVTGLSDEHYIVFESMDETRANLYVDESNTIGCAVNIEAVDNIRFRNLRFVRRGGEVTNMVKLASTSVNCRFENCIFYDSVSNPLGSMRIAAMIDNYMATNLIVDGCTFTGGRMGVSVRGESNLVRSSTASVSNSLFYNQNENAIRVEYMNDVEVVGNEMYDVLTNASSVLLLNSVGGTVKVLNNKGYVSHGASVLTLNMVDGAADNRIVVANNMFVGNDDGQAAQMSNPVSVLNSSYIDFVYNAVRLIANSRMNMAAVNFGGNVSNSKFVNNIVASMDSTNYAFGYMPGAITSNMVCHNVYYSEGLSLNRYNGTAYISISDWQVYAAPTDTGSVSMNPVFLNSSLVDLRTFNKQLKGMGIPIEGVTTDMFGNERSEETPCPGAFEFSALPYDFEATALIEPTDNCYMPDQVELIFAIGNNGVNGLDPETATEKLTINWTINGKGQDSYEVAQTILAEDTITVATGKTVHLPANGTLDSVYIIKTWMTFANDPNRSNDTSVFRVVSRYHPVAPNAIIDSLEYAQRDTIVPTGLTQWSMYKSGSAPKWTSRVYWYADSTTSEPFYIGDTLVTDELRTDTVFYIRQRRDVPMVRITQVELVQVSNAAGLSSPMPYWMADLRKAALQLTNVGDAPAYLKGDTLLMLGTSAALNNKVYVFGDVVIEPGKSLVLQYASQAETDSSLTIHTNISGFTIPATPSIAFVYKHGGRVEDAIPFNDVMNSTLATSWLNSNIPSYVWTGEAISFTGNIAGVVRTKFDGSVSDWNLSSDTPMTLGKTNSDWIRYEDGGCEGEYAEVRVGIIAPPEVELSLAEPILPADGCGLGEEELSVDVYNYGSDSVSMIPIHYTIGGDTVSEMMEEPIAPFSMARYTFNQKMNLDFGRDSIVTVRVWVTAHEKDPMQNNDSSMAQVHSAFTPDAPDTTFTRYVKYATRDTVTIKEIPSLIPVWYDNNMNVVDTGNVHITELLYQNGTRGVAYMANDTIKGLLGDQVETNTAQQMPTPYLPVSKYVKQQYIYTAHELRSAGLKKGEITGLEFSISDVPGDDTIQLINYTLSLMHVTDTVFATTSSWKPVSDTLFSRDTLFIAPDDDNKWMSHSFSKPFMWDGESAVVMQIAYDVTKLVSSGIKTHCFDKKSYAALYKNTNAALTPSSYSYVGSGTRNSVVPTVRFNEIVNGCIGNYTTYNVVVTDVPAIDVALSWPDNMDTHTYVSCDTIFLPFTFSNQGSDAVDTVMVSYILDDQEPDTILYVGNYVSEQVVNATLINDHLLPGVHTISVVASASGDSVSSNDTIRTTFMVRFCGGEYVVNGDSTGDYTSVVEAVNVLNEVGMTGSVVIKVEDGNYHGNVVLRDMYRASADNSVTIEGASDNAVLTATTTADESYVMMVNGTSNIRIKNLKMASRPIPTNPSNPSTVSKANVLLIKNSENVLVDSCQLTVQDNAVDTGSAAIALRGKVDNLHIVNSVMDSGAYSIKGAAASGKNKGIRIENNQLTNFAHGGIRLRGAERLRIKSNTLSSGNSGSNRGLIGIYVSTTSDTMRIEKNKINLIDEMTSAKRGIQVERITSSMLNPAYITNNMISTHGTDVKGLTPSKSAGIWVDSISSYVYVSFNTVQVYATPLRNATANISSYAFYSGASVDHVQVMNNILSNASYGYAYYVKEKGTVISSNFNAYYSMSPIPFAWKADTLADISALQVENSDDGNSFFDEPYFVSDEDLHLMKASVAEKGQYNAEVIDDIDGNLRQQMPGPTIGAQEMVRSLHDLAIIRVTEPRLPASITTPYNIETDSVRVIATLCNNGLLTEYNVTWYAYIEGYEAETRTINKNAGTFSPLESKVDTLMMPTVVGITDYQNVRIIIVSTDEDTVTYNNEKEAGVYLSPAYNLTVTKMAFNGGCNLKSTPITITLRNVGQKPIPAGSTIKIGYHAEVNSPSNVYISTMPDTVEENVTLSSNFAVATTQDFIFSNNANLYPTDTGVNISVRVYGWCKYEHDVLVDNDTTKSNATATRDSYYTPEPPFGHDTTISYGSWGEIIAEQANSRPIRWYRDTTSTPFYTSTSYAMSTKWGPTPQYFHDSTYFLDCVSDKGCRSKFSTVKVNVAPRLTRDVAMEEVIAPLGKRVYMENDTVKVKVSNYGTSAQGSVPVTYELRRNQILLQTVTENIPSLAAGETVEYKFSTLLDLPQPTTAQNFTINAYTDLTNDGCRRNDTLRKTYYFSSYSVDRYNEFDEYPSDEPTTKFDISRVSFSDINLRMPAMNRDYTNLADFDDPDYPVLHVRRGMSDTMMIEVSPVEPSKQRYRCRASVYIDLNRDGYFSNTNLDCQEIAISDEAFYNDSIFKGLVTIPQCAELGYMRMRVKVMGIADETNEGHIIDFLIFVDGNVPDVDLALTQIVSPSTSLIKTDDSVAVSFRMDNRGKNNVESADIYYRFYDDDFHYTGQPIIDTIDYGDTVVFDTVAMDSTGIGVYHWVGTLAPGNSTLITLPKRAFLTGITDLSIWHEYNNDKKHANDSIHMEFYHFPVLTLTYFDDFDSADLWYAPKGTSEYDRNFWQRGNPTKARLKATYSGENAWVTDLHNPIVTGRRGNYSYLYSPIFDVASIRCDTLRFRMLRNLTAGSQAYVEFYSFDGTWVKLDRDSINTWYNDPDNHAFTGTTPSSENYTLYTISTTGKGAPAGLPQMLQLRFVYKTPIGSNSAAGFGEGCAVDDFEFVRARIKADGGVVGIVHPSTPRYGEQINPKVLVHNFGSDTLKSYQVAFTYYGSALAKISNFSTYIPPDKTVEVECEQSFVVTSDFPDTFLMKAYTIIPDDKYYDNDASSRLITIMPLDDDISAEAIVAPLDKAVAGDSTVQVTLRMQNFGFNSVHEVRAGYYVNGVHFTDEFINFDSLLGGPLEPFGYYEYTFDQLMTPSLGVNNIVGYVKFTDPSIFTYEYNDTVEKRIMGDMSVSDLAAVGIQLDTKARAGEVRVAVTIANRGTTSANGFQIGFMIDDDTSTTVIETFNQATPIKALSTGVHTFDYVLLKRPKPYDKVKAFVYIENDNDRSNDTTDVFLQSESDVHLVKFLVEENAAPNCQVYAQIRNEGNAPFYNTQFRFHTVINGDSLVHQFTPEYLLPGETMHIKFNTTVPKRFDRIYEGYGWVEKIDIDTNQLNDTTYVVERVNYVDGIDEVDKASVSLEQNYPNPFTQYTVIPFTIDMPANVRFMVFDAMGHLLLVDEQFYQAGRHELSIDFSGHPTGIYYYGIDVEGVRKMRKMILK